MKTIKVAIIIGTRPEAIKLVPLYLELKRREDFEPIILSTGQHKEMLAQVFDFFSVEPDLDLELMFSNQTLSGITSLLYTNLQKTIEEISPDLIVVQGDTQSAMVGSMIGFYNRIKVAHVEAGLRTNDKYSPFPEEINRQIIGLVADYNFCPTEVTADNLKAEGKENIFVVGNTVIDAVLLCKEKVSNNLRKYHKKFDYVDHFEKVILVTGHRRENFSGGLQNVSLAIKELAEENEDICFIYPVHLNPKVLEIVKSELAEIENVKLIEPLIYDELVYLLDRSYLVLTDSGGIQEEAPSLNTPVLVTRDTTERPEGVKGGCSLLVGTDTTLIKKAFNRLLEDQEYYEMMANAKNPYGDGKTAIYIADVLAQVVF